MIRRALGSTPSAPTTDESLAALAAYIDAAAPERSLNDDLRHTDDWAPYDTPVQREPRGNYGFFAMGEETEDPGEDPEFMADDISSTAHAELEQLRELRQYARVTAWDMPLLFGEFRPAAASVFFLPFPAHAFWRYRPVPVASMDALTLRVITPAAHAQPFEPPTAATPLRFRYTTYLGETHPAARKVVLTFAPAALPELTRAQADKLVKLLGVRYDPASGRAKMSCELFATPAQNKRHLGQTLDALLAECVDPDADMFVDVPFDFRHAKVKRVHVFPEAWKMTEERRRALEEGRRERAGLEMGRKEAGEMVEGVGVIEKHLLGGGVRQTEPVLVSGAIGGSGKASDKGKRRLTRTI